MAILIINLCIRTHTHTLILIISWSGENKAWEGTYNDQHSQSGNSKGQVFMTVEHYDKVQNYALKLKTCEF